MTINIIYFASLREQIGRGKDEITSETPITAMQAWSQATGQDTIPGNVLIALNHEYVSADTLVKSGDELAFFPPVTGG